MPDHWQPTTLKNVADIKVGPAFKSSVYRSCVNGVPIVRGMNIGPSGLRWDETFFWPADDLASYKQFLLAAGQTVVAMDATFASDGRIRAGLIVKSDLPLLLNQRVAAINPGPSVLQQFVFLLVLTERFRSYLNRLQTGSFAPHISKTDLTDFAFDLPPLSEQRRIVDLIESIDNHIDALQDQIAATRTTRQGVLSDLFDNHGAATTNVGSLVGPKGVQIGPFGSQLHKSDYVETGRAVVMPKDMVDGVVNLSTVARIPEAKALELQRHVLEPGDVLLPRRGDLHKRVLVDEELSGALCGTGTVRIRPANVNGEALLYMLSTGRVNRWLDQNAVGGTMPNINSRIVESIPVKVPDRLEESVELIKSFDAQIASLETQISDARSLRSGVLSDLLSGDRLLDESYDKAVGW